ncbi:hypothetical protein [Amycolatopsis sp. lyj-109]|uniref:hypothetical protein n=1 Tax=Amycolatopsis sp. lyj-109 TaxID=2789287 RepID=UPI00397ACDD5
MTELEIRRATPTEAGTLTALMHASSAHQGDYASILDGYAIAPGYVEANPTFVATGDGGILGFYAPARVGVLRPDGRAAHRHDPGEDSLGPAGAPLRRPYRLIM